LQITRPERLTEVRPIGGGLVVSDYSAFVFDTSCTELSVIEKYFQIAIGSASFTVNEMRSSPH
jgi:hypothetical protein